MESTAPTLQPVQAATGAVQPIQAASVPVQHPRSESSAIAGQNAGFAIARPCERAWCHHEILQCVMVKNYSGQWLPEPHEAPRQRRQSDMKGRNTKR
jgi:hypothetical protein